MALQKLRYNITPAQIYTFSQRVNVPENCNGFVATNLGDTIVRINDYTLFPSPTPATAAGDSISFGGNENEVYTGQLKISFVVPLGATPQVEIGFKFYSENC